MTDQPTLRERIGGRRAISWQYAAFIVVISTLIFPYATRIGGADTVSLGERLGMLVIADLAALAILPVAAITVFRARRERPVPVWSVFAVGALVAVTRELILRGILDFSDLRIEGSWGLRMGALAILSGGFSIGFALLLDEIDRLRQGIAEINERLVGLRVQERLNEQLAVELEAAAEGEIEAAADDVLTRVNGALGGTDPVARAAAAEDLRAFVETRIRPLSAQLYDVAETALPQVRIRDILRECVSTRPVRPVATGLLCALPIFIFQLAQYSLGDALLQAGTHAALVAGALAAVALASRRGYVRGAALPIAAATAIALTSIKVLLSGNASIGSGILISSGTWVLASVIAVALLDAVFYGRAKELPSIRATLDSQAVDAIAERREIVRASRDLATFVHGTLQSTLLATAFAIEDASRLRDEGRVNETLEAARQALGSLHAERQVPAPDIGSELRRRSQMWRGYLDVTVEVECAGPLPPAVIEIAGNVVQEALANARKHGDARHVGVKVVRDGGVLMVTVRDDGSGPCGGDRGLGSRQLDAVAGTRWALSDNDHEPGATLRAAIPLDLPTATTA